MRHNFLERERDGEKRDESDSLKLFRLIMMYRAQVLLFSFNERRNRREKKKREKRENFFVVGSCPTDFFIFLI